MRKILLSLIILTSYFLSIPCFALTLGVELELSTCGVIIGASTGKGNSGVVMRTPEYSFCRWGEITPGNFAFTSDIDPAFKKTGYKSAPHHVQYGGDSTYAARGLEFVNPRPYTSFNEVKDGLSQFSDFLDKSAESITGSWTSELPLACRRDSGGIELSAWGRADVPMEYSFKDGSQTRNFKVKVKCKKGVNILTDGVIPQVTFDMKASRLLTFFKKRYPFKEVPSSIITLFEDFIDNYPKESLRNLEPNERGFLLYLSVYIFEMIFFKKEHPQTTIYYPKMAHHLLLRNNWHMYRMKFSNLKNSTILQFVRDFFKAAKGYSYNNKSVELSSDIYNHKIYDSNNYTVRDFLQFVLFGKIFFTPQDALDFKEVLGYKMSFSGGGDFSLAIEMRKIRGDNFSYKMKNALLEVYQIAWWLQQFEQLKEGEGISDYGRTSRLKERELLVPFSKLISSKVPSAQNTPESLGKSRGHNGGGRGGENSKKPTGKPRVLFPE